MRRKLNFLALTILVLECTGVSLHAQMPTIPPTVTRVSPPGLRRGTTAVLTLEGRSLVGAQAVLFDAPGLTGKFLDVKDLPEEAKRPRPGVDTSAAVPLGVKQEARLEVTVAPDAESGLHRFRVQTPLGTSNDAVVDVGSLPEIREKEPNNGAGESQPIEFPATLVGTLGWAGDVDSFEFKARSGEELVFQTVASSLGSALQSVLVLRDSAGNVVVRSGYLARRPDAALTFKVPSDGQYTISISDIGQRGGDSLFYRLNVGALPYVTTVFPLGVRAGQATEVEVEGPNLGEVHRVRVQAPSSTEGWQTVPLRVKTSQGESLNTWKLAVRDEPEITEVEPNDSPGEAQRITLPVTINGYIGGARKAPGVDEDYFRFIARKGQRLTVEVAAARLGSPLDSVVEVLDSQGRGITLAKVRCLVETSMTLADRDSMTPNIRLTSVSGLGVSDYLMIGDELVELSFVPDQPDADLVLSNYKGQRFALWNTSPDVHPMNSPVYKAQILDPGVEVPPNGLPVFRLTARNDDGGPGYGQDSRLDFTAPYDGDYLLRIKDTRGLQGEDYAYRLTVREARQEFTIASDPENPNVPRGGRVPLQVSVNRTLGYRGPIEVELRGLPQGITATRATIPAGQDLAVLLLTASPDAPAMSASPFQVVGRATVEGRELVRVVEGDPRLRVVSVMPPPDLLVAAEPKEIVLEPGRTTTVTLRVERKNTFQGRVPCKVVNLPPGVAVDNNGLNGVLVSESETSRTILLRALNWAPPIEQPIYFVGTVESNASTFHASPPLILKVLARQQTANADAPRAAPNR